MLLLRKGKKNRLNVLFLVHYPELYGSIRSLLDLVNGLRAYSVFPYFIVPAGGSLSKVLDDDGITYEIVSLPRWVSEKPASITGQFKLRAQLLQSAKVITEYIKSWKIDLVYTNTLVTPVGILAAKRASVPHILHIREYGDLDFNLIYVFPKKITQALLGRSDDIICHSFTVRDHHFGPNFMHVHQIYNGVATRYQFDQRRTIRNSCVPNEIFTFSMLSTITLNKGQEVALKALARLREQGVLARLILAGHGKSEYLLRVKQLTQELGIENQVTFYGFVEDPFPIYYQSDCVLVCSEHEAFSRVALEAMSTALPVIGKNSGGNPEIIVPGETGFLYDPFDELVAGMKSMVKEREQARQMGLAGWQRARDLFNIEDYSANVYRVIQSVMEKR